MKPNLTTNLIALAIVLLSLSLPEPARAVGLSTGLFALSGALTNWLAVHMLFERVPGLYGSGVIVLRFEEFKASIMRLVREHLFTAEKVDSYFATQSSAAADIDLEPIIANLDMDAAFDQLVATILDSSFGSMLSMVGGATALEPMRETFKKRMSSFLTNATQSPKFQQAVSDQIASLASSDQFIEKIEGVLQSRLDELTPQMVRDIMQQVMRKHLGWLVIWGGVFGGLIGLVTGIARYAL
ncbi:MAG: DUF445 domain-containing protein [Gammaproteobacteria bacterium]|nr:DUF445 domain-containing protein [Gammaproteobacteria bacterium]